MEIIIRENDSLPIYEQIVREVKKAIIKKEIMPGDMMPSIRALPESWRLVLSQQNVHMRSLKKSN